MVCECNASSDVVLNETETMVAVDLGQPTGKPVNGHPNGINGVVKRGTQGRSTRSNPQSHAVNPYAPRYADFLSNVSNFNIIESTLRGILFI